MASTTYNTIIISDTDPLRFEKKAAGVAITPGELLYLATADTVGIFNTANGNAAPLFALENPYAEPVAGTPAIDNAYGTADTVYFTHARAGDQIYAWLEPNGSVNAGGYLSAGGTVGALQAYAGGTALAPLRVVGFALESKTASSSRVRVKIQAV
jgi:hypothetical protein